MKKGTIVETSDGQLLPLETDFVTVPFKHPEPDSTAFAIEPPHADVLEKQAEIVLITGHAGLGLSAAHEVLKHAADGIIVIDDYKPGDDYAAYMPAIPSHLRPQFEKALKEYIEKTSIIMQKQDPNLLLDQKVNFNESDKKKLGALGADEQIMERKPHQPVFAPNKRVSKNRNSAQSPLQKKKAKARMSKQSRKKNRK